MDKLTVENLLMPSCGQYRREDIAKSDCLWGGSPKVSPDGTKVAFFATRDGVYYPERIDWPDWEENSKGYQLWIKDLVSGDEQLIMNTHALIIGWSDSKTLFFEDCDDPGNNYYSEKLVQIQYFYLQDLEK